MKLLDIFSVILPNMQSVEKKAVMREMLEALIEQQKLDSASSKKVFKALMDREELGSTGIGRGVAVPHAKHNSVHELLGVFGKTTDGVVFEALDGEPVDIFFMVLSSRKASEDHLVALAKIAALVKNDNFVRFLRNAGTEEEIKEIFTDADETLFDGA